MEEGEFEDQEEIIQYVKSSLDQIQNAKSKELKEHHLFQLLAYLISSSNDIAETGDFYEAAGRLYSAAYYLEDFYIDRAREVYTKANEYYSKYLTEKIREGAVNDAANIAIKIANIYSKKLLDPESERIYILKAIGFIANQIEILHGVGSPREICGKFQILATLYGQIEDWNNVIVAGNSALAIAKEIKEYSIISNAYHDIAYAFQENEQPKQAQNILIEAMDYFSKEASYYEDKQDFLPLSQLYQIIKNLYSDLRNQKKYKLYSKKEAGVYIAMAKLSLLYNTSNAQIASYYRGAALCYRETNQNDLDSASCFFIAGDYYHDAKKFLEAAINFEDAAKIFENLGKMKKAYELYIKAGENAAKANSLQPAIENFMWAYEIAKTNNFSIQKIFSFLIKNFQKLAEIEEAGNNHFVAATLQLEAANYMKKASKNSVDKIQSVLSKAAHNYWRCANLEKGVGKNSIKIYSNALASLLFHITSDLQMFDESMQKLQNCNSKNGPKYTALISAVLEYYNNRNNHPFSPTDEAMIKLLQNSEEIHVILEIMNR